MKLFGLFKYIVIVFNQSGWPIVLKFVEKEFISSCEQLSLLFQYGPVAKDMVVSSSLAISVGFSTGLAALPTALQS